MTGYRYKSVKNLNKSVKVRGYLLIWREIVDSHVIKADLSIADTGKNRAEKIARAIMEQSYKASYGYLLPEQEDRWGKF